VTLTGSGTDDDGTIVAYEWTQTSGLSATIVSPNSATTDIEGLSNEGVYEFQLTVTDDSAATASDAVSVSVVNADGMPSSYKAATPPNIDAVQDDAYLNGGEMLNQTIGTTFPSASDLSANWKTTWDENNFYVFIEVTDESQNTSSQWYQSDLIEVYIDGDNSKGASYDNANDFQYAYVWNSGGIREEQYSSGDATVGVNASQQATANGYNTEIAFPWSTLNVTPSVGYIMGVDFHTCDNDGSGREDKLAWSAIDDNAWQQPSVFGEIVLRDETTNTQQLADNNSQIRIYPNPVLNGNLNIIPQADVTISNITGVIVKQAAQTSYLDVSGLPSGIYIVNAEVDGYSKIIKMIIP
jgi:oligosaccharide reducing-end xylanase